MKLKIKLVAVVSIFYSISSVAEQPTIVPEHEHAKAHHQQAEGPTKSKGIRSVTQLGELDLQKEFPTIGQRAMRAREIVIEPGGIVAVHQHDQRPGVAYILEGEIYENRSDSDRPLLRKAGDVSFEYSGVIHWWENKSGKTVRALVIDVVTNK